MLAVAASKGNLRAAFLKLRRSTKHNLVVDSSEGGQLCFFLVMVRHIPEQKRLESTHFQHRDASKPAMSYQLGIAMPPLRVTGCTGAVGSTKRVFGRLFLIVQGFLVKRSRVKVWLWASGLQRASSNTMSLKQHGKGPAAKSHSTGEGGEQVRLVPYQVRHNRYVLLAPDTIQIISLKPPNCSPE